jgi:hypothetical protein
MPATYLDVGELAQGETTTPIEAWLDRNLSELRGKLQVRGAVLKTAHSAQEFVADEAGRALWFGQAHVFHRSFSRLALGVGWQPGDVLLLDRSIRDRRRGAR